MAEVYAQHLELRQKVNDQFPAQFAKLLRVWLTKRWPRDHSDLDPHVPATFRGADATIFRWEPFVSPYGYFADFIMRHGDPTDPTSSWSTRVSVHQSTVVSVRIRISNSHGGENSKVRLTSRPRLAVMLAELGGCVCDGQPLQLPPLRRSAQEIQDLAAYVLCDPDRQYPVIVLTPRMDGTFVADPDQVADEFATLGSFVVAANASATYALTEELGRRELSCFNGALRVYLPGFSRDADPLKHPLMLPSMLANKPTRLALGHILGRYTLKRYVEPPLMNEMRDLRAIAYQKARDNDQKLRDDQVAKLRELAIQSGENAQWLEIAENFEKENVALKQEKAELQARLFEAEAKADALAYSLRTRDDGHSDIDDIEFPSSAQSIEEAVDLAEEWFGENVIFLESARESAQESNFDRPADVLSAFKAMAEIARGAVGGEVGQPLKQAFEARGFDYKSGIAKTSPAKVRAQHKFQHDGNAIYCEEHLAFGIAYDPKKCLRIYFSSDEIAEGRFIVGHVGRHLDTKKTN